MLKYLQPVSGDVMASDYRLDIYHPDGTFLTQVTGLAAARLEVDLWRNIYTLNYEIVQGTGRTEPSVSLWIPSDACRELILKEDYTPMRPLNRWKMQLNNPSPGDTSLLWALTVYTRPDPYRGGTEFGGFIAYVVQAYRDENQEIFQLWDMGDGSVAISSLKARADKGACLNGNGPFFSSRQFYGDPHGAIVITEIETANWECIAGPEEMFQLHPVSFGAVALYSLSPGRVDSGSGPAAYGACHGYVGITTDWAMLRGGFGDDISQAIPIWPIGLDRAPFLDLLEVNKSALGLNLNGVDLSGLDFTSWVLDDINLTGVGAIRSTNFTSAQMHRAVLKSRQDLATAIFTKADLNGADLEGANLTMVNFSGVILAGAKLAGADVSNNKTLGQLDFNQADLSNSKLDGTDFSGAYLQAAVLKGASMTGANFTGAHLVGADLSNSVLTGCRFDGADLTGANFSGATLTGCVFGTANLTGANLGGTNLLGVDLTKFTHSTDPLQRTDLANVTVKFSDIGLN